MSKCKQCEELKNKIDIMREENRIDALETRKLIAYYSEELKRLRQILAHIKEIAEKGFESSQLTKLMLDLILQKISECEGNDE